MMMLKVYIAYHWIDINNSGQYKKIIIRLTFPVNGFILINLIFMFNMTLVVGVREDDSTCMVLLFTIRKRRDFVYGKCQYEVLYRNIKSFHNKII